MKQMESLERAIKSTKFGNLLLICLHTGRLDYIYREYKMARPSTDQEKENWAKMMLKRIENGEIPENTDK